MAQSASLDPSAIHYRYDPESLLSFEEIVVDAQSRSLHTRFDSAEIPVGRGAHWVFLTIKQRETLPPEDWMLEVSFPNIDRFDAMVQYGDGTIETYSAGDEIAFDKWPVKYRQPTIPLQLLGQYDALVVFRIRSETPLILPLSLLTANEQNDAQRVDHFLYGLFYGAIFILTLYNAGVYFSLRDPSYRFYILYILAFSLVQASTTGIGQQYLWPGLDNTTTRLALLAIILTNYFMVRFVIDFLDLSTHQPALITPLRWLANIALLIAPLLLFPRYAYTQYAIHGLNILCMLVITTTAIAMLKRNRGPAVYLLASYSVLFSSIILALMFQANLIERYAFIDFSMSVAILVEAVILSIGLSARIARLRLEREQSERARRIAQEELSQQLIQVREHERAEISKLLHDSINHDLVVIRKKIANLGASGEGGTSSLQNEKDTIDQMLNKAIGDIRDISHLTHPQIVQHLGLETAFRVLLGSAFDSSVSWDLYFEPVKLNYPAELFLYRAGQELTTNIIKHANASECLVRLLRDDKQQQVTFILKDDGDGFVSLPGNWHFGLRTLNEHCKSVSGSLNIDSIPGEGTTVTITLPLPQ